MSRILLDANMPIGLTGALSDHQVRTAFQLGWSLLENGDLLKAAEESGFELMLTADQNIRYQQNLTGRRLALVVLGTNHWPTIRAGLPSVIRAVNEASSGSYTAVQFPLPSRNPRIR